VEKPESEQFWRRCSICKKPIAYQSLYQKCNVSTCRKHAYCSVDCWSVHVPVMGHKSSWAEEETAPANNGNDRETESTGATPVRRLIIDNKSSSNQSATADSSAYSTTDVLIVASKLKDYVKNKHGMNTSGNVMEELSHNVRRIVDDAVIRARQEGRKTLMDRDFQA
jgi:hypothetical protein